MVRIKRIYEQKDAADGYRVLVDRLWPRGVSKQEAAVDVWLKQIAPSQALREWFGHKPERFEEFAARYQHELAHNDAVKELQEIIKHHSTVTLLYSARDTEHNQAVVLLNFITNNL